MYYFLYFSIVNCLKVFYPVKYFLTFCTNCGFTVISWSIDFSFSSSSIHFNICTKQTGENIKIDLYHTPSCKSAFFTSWSILWSIAGLLYFSGLSWKQTIPSFWLMLAKISPSSIYTESKECNNCAQDIIRILCVTIFKSKDKKQQTKPTHHVQHIFLCFLWAWQLHSTCHVLQRQCQEGLQETENRFVWNFCCNHELKHMYHSLL